MEWNLIKSIFWFLQRSKKNYKSSGQVHLIHCEVRKAYTFLDYVQGGTELACTISIDFTASNGSPNNPDSLHFYSPYGGSVNQYEMAIRAVGDIIEDYDSDKLFPVLGISFFTSFLLPLFHVNFEICTHSLQR
jgi:hypothetical protein